MKMYENYENSRDHCSKYFGPQDNALISCFLPNGFFSENGGGNHEDYLLDYQGNYINVDSTATSKQLIFKTDPDEDSEAWKKKEQMDWTSSDVLHWIANVAENQKFPYEFVNANAFNVDGKTLSSFSKKQFIESDEKYGSLLYDALHKTGLKYNNMFKVENIKNEVKLETLSTSSKISEGLISFTSENSKQGPPYGLVRGPEAYSTDLNNSQESYPFDLNASREVGDPSNEFFGDEKRNSSDISVSSDAEQSDSELKKQSKKSGSGKRPPGRPPGVKSKKEKPEKKTGRLWEFIRDLLLDPQHCPSVICWENHDDGVFRFVKSEKVAKIWGDRKGNEKMNYEKLSRAMRYYYRSKVLQPVIGRRLVYKFGPTARGWKTENPNFRH